MVQEKRMTRTDFMRTCTTSKDLDDGDKLHALCIAEVHQEVKDEICMEAEPFETDKTIFVGHTPTLDGKPFISERYHLVALDTGAGGNGPLTLMDMDTLGYWQA